MAAIRNIPAFVFRWNATRATFGLPAAAQDGSVPTPGITFENDLDTGISRQGANSLAIGAGGTQTMLVQPGGFMGGDGTNGCAYIPRVAGTAAAPAFTFIGDLGTGVFRPAGNQIGFATNGVLRATLSNSRFLLAVPLALSTAYTAGAPAATGYLNIQDSTGTNYRVLCAP